MLLILQRPYKLTIHTSVRHTVATYKNTPFQPCRYIDNYAVASQSTALRPDIPNPTHTPGAAPAPLRFAPALTTVNMLRTHHCQHAPHAKSHNLPSLAPRMRRLLHPARVYWNHAENAKASALRPSRKHIPTTHSSPATHLHIRDLFCACCTTTNSTEVRHSQTSISSGCFQCSRPAQIQVCTNSYPGYFALNPQSIVNGIRPSLMLPTNTVARLADPTLHRLQTATCSRFTRLLQVSEQTPLHQSDQAPTKSPGRRQS